MSLSGREQRFDLVAKAANDEFINRVRGLEECINPGDAVGDITQLLHDDAAVRAADSTGYAVADLFGQELNECSGKVGDALMKSSLSRIIIFNRQRTVYHPSNKLESRTVEDRTVLDALLRVHYSSVALRPSGVDHPYAVLAVAVALPVCAPFSERYNPVAHVGVSTVTPDPDRAYKSWGPIPAAIGGDTDPYLRAVEYREDQRFGS